MRAMKKHQAYHKKQQYFNGTYPAGFLSWLMLSPELTYPVKIDSVEDDSSPFL